MADSAPLVDTPLAPVPPGGEAEWFSGAGGAKLRGAIFFPDEPARGSVVLSGGRTEPIEKYFETIEDFRARGFVVVAHDWRGQGLSARALGDRLKGHARGYDAFLGDFRALLAAFESRMPKPWIAVGHSMGGCLTLLALAQGEDRFAAAVLSAPMLGIRTGSVPLARARMMTRMQVTFGRAARYVQGDPGKPFDTDFEANSLTHDRRRFERNCALLAAEPDLALGAPTWGWLDFAFRATAFLSRPDRLRDVTIPVVIVSAEEDTLVDNTAQAAAARHLPQGKLVSVPGAYHEILMERDEMRNIFLRVFDALTGRVAPKPTSTVKTVGAYQAAPVAAPAAASPPPLPVEAPSAGVATVPLTTGDTDMAKAVAKKPAAKKPAAKKPAAKKPAAAKAKPAAAKKPAVKKPAVKKPAVKKPAAKKPAAKKTVAKKTVAKKTVAKKPAAKKPAARKTVAKKPAAKKAPARKVAAKKTVRKTVSKAKKAPARKMTAKKAPARKTVRKAAKKK